MCCTCNITAPGSWDAVSYRSAPSIQSIYISLCRYASIFYVIYCLAVCVNVDAFSRFSSVSIFEQGTHVRNNVLVFLVVSMVRAPPVGK